MVHNNYEVLITIFATIAEPVFEELLSGHMIHVRTDRQLHMYCQW